MDEYVDGEMKQQNECVVNKLTQERDREKKLLNGEIRKEINHGEMNDAWKRQRKRLRRAQTLIIENQQTKSCTTSLDSQD